LVVADRSFPQRVAGALGLIASGSVAGALAYFLSNFDVLGIAVDTSSLRGFVILGFLFSYVGVDLILKTLVSPKS